MKRLLILVLAITTLAVARDKKPKSPSGPYVFTSTASSQTLKPLIIQYQMTYGYALDSENQFQLHFSKVAQLPSSTWLWSVPNACKAMPTKKVVSFTLVELNGATTVTVDPLWEYPGTYCRPETSQLIWEPDGQIAAFREMLDKASALVAKAP